MKEKTKMVESLGILKKSLLKRKKLVLSLIIFLGFTYFISINVLALHKCKYEAVPVEIPEELQGAEIIFEEERSVYNQDKNRFSEEACSIKGTPLSGRIVTLSSWEISGVLKRSELSFVRKGEKFELLSAYNLRCVRSIRCFSVGDRGLVMILKNSNGNKWVISPGSFSHHDYNQSNTATTKNKLLASYSINGETRGFFNPKIFFDKEDGYFFLD